MQPLLAGCNRKESVCFQKIKNTPIPVDPDLRFMTSEVEAVFNRIGAEPRLVPFS